MTALKIPPPPPIANMDPAFNRWLLELTSILNTAGGIDTSQIPGYANLQAQVTKNTTDIATANGNITSLFNGVGGNNASIASLTTRMTTAEGNITTLQARNQVLNGTGAPAAGTGNNGDVYLNNTGGAGTRFYGKIGGAWVAIA